jgi:O-antigen ligase
MEKIIKIVLALLLLTCLLNMPYGYFQLVRFIAMVGFAILAFSASQKKDQTELIICVVLAVLFQPLFKISLGRTIWNIVDVVVAIGLLLSLSNKPDKSN